jgi:hypothetical protein
LIELDLTCYSKYIDLAWVGPLVLCREEVGRIPDGVPGVYLLHCFEPTGGYYPVLYAGKAVDLGRRLEQHLRSRCTAPEVVLVREGVRLYFSAAPVLEPGTLDRVEAGLVRVHRPPFNRQRPTAEPLYSNLPPILFERRTS